MAETAENKQSEKERGPIFGRTMLASTISAIISGLLVAGIITIFPGILHQAITPTLPRTAIIAFEGACPPDWDPYELAQGRFVIGSGRLPDGTDLQRNPIGGQTTVTLNTENLPRMEISAPSSVRGAAPPGGRDYQFRVLDGAERFPLGAVGAAGPAVPIPILPPYVALSYCKRPS